LGFGEAKFKYSVFSKELVEYYKSCVDRYHGGKDNCDHYAFVKTSSFSIVA